MILSMKQCLIIMLSMNIDQKTGYIFKDAHIHCLTVNLTDTSAF